MLMCLCFPRSNEGAVPRDAFMVFRAKTVAVVPGLCAFLGHLSKFSLTLPMANADVALFSLKILQSETNCALSFGIHNVFGLFNAPLLGFHTSRHKILPC